MVDLAHHIQTIIDQIDTQTYLSNLITMSLSFLTSAPNLSEWSVFQIDQVYTALTLAAASLCVVPISTLFVSSATCDVGKELTSAQTAYVNAICSAEIGKGSFNVLILIAVQSVLLYGLHVRYGVIHQGGAALMRYVSFAHSVIKKHVDEWENQEAEAWKSLATNNSRQQFLRQELETLIDISFIRFDQSTLSVDDSDSAILLPSKRVDFFYLPGQFHRAFLQLYSEVNESDTSRLQRFRFEDRPEEMPYGAFFLEDELRWLMDQYHKEIHTFREVCNSIAAVSKYSSNFMSKLSNPTQPPLSASSPGNFDAPEFSYLFSSALATIPMTGVVVIISRYSQFYRRYAWIQLSITILSSISIIIWLFTGLIISDSFACTRAQNVTCQYSGAAPLNASTFVNLILVISLALIGAYRLSRTQRSSHDFIMKVLADRFPETIHRFQLMTSRMCKWTSYWFVEICVEEALGTVFDKRNPAISRQIRYAM